MRFVLLLIAAVIAVGVGVFVLQFSGKNAAPAPEEKAAAVNVTTVQVLVAKSPIAMGTVLDETMIDRQPWPSHLLLDGMITADSKDANLAGKVARAPLAAREPFMTTKLANLNDPGFLAANLPEGMRAVTIATDSISGIAGYIFPGDHVDILLTHNIPQELKASYMKGGFAVRGKPDLSEVLLANVRVLAVNIRPVTVKEAAAAGSAPNNVTVEVSEAAAQEIRLAEKNGSLSLALRSIKDQSDTNIGEVMSVQNLSRVGGVVDEGSDGAVRIIRGAGKESDGQFNQFNPAGNSPPYGIKPYGIKMPAGSSIIRSGM